MISIVNRPNLAILTEAINITREAWRGYITQILTREEILAIVFDFFSQNPKDLGYIKQKAHEVEAIQCSVRDIIDISCGHYITPELVQKHASNKIGSEFNDAIKNIRSIKDIRNEVCHPPSKDITPDQLTRDLLRIHNFLASINAAKQVVDTIDSLDSLEPFSQSYLPQGLVKTRDRLEAVDQARRSTENQMQRQRVLLLPFFSIVSGITGVLLVSALAIFQPTQFQQMLVSMTSVVPPMVSAPVPILVPAKLYAENKQEYASIVVALQRAENDLTSKDEELTSVRSGLAEKETELIEINFELERTQDVLTTVQTTLLSTEKALEVIKAEQADTAESVTGELLEVSDPSVPTLIDTTRVRTGPGAAFEVVETLPKGVTVQLVGIDASGDWYLLSSSSWVPATNIDGQIPESLPVTTLGRVLVAAANLRQEPTTVSPVLGTVRQGQIVVLVGQQEGSQPAGTWYQLDSGDWIYGDLVAVLP